jgi:hypothetical protein
MKSREDVMRLMLKACGERGYRSIRLEGLDGQNGHPLPGGWFRDAADCFANGYVREGERLRLLVARAGQAGACGRDALEAVLEELSSFIDACPAVARSLLAEVHVVGGRALQERARLLAELARTIDEHYRVEGVSPPALDDAASFMVDVIETVALRASVAEDASILATAIPDLAQMLEDLYGRVDTDPDSHPGP